MLAGMCMVTARMLLNLERIMAPRPCMSFKCALAGIWRCWTMTVTMPSWPTWSLRSAENFDVAAAAPVVIMFVTVVTGVKWVPQTTDSEFGWLAAAENFDVAAAAPVVIMFVTVVTGVKWVPQTTDSEFGLLAA